MNEFAPPRQLNGYPDMVMTPAINSAMRGFRDIILGGIPFLLRQNETAFLSFMCSVAAIDALAGYRYATDDVGTRFRNFIKEYFPPKYSTHVEDLYVFRCRLLHNFSPAYFTVTHAQPDKHLAKSDIGDTILSDESFFADLAAASEKFFAEVIADPARQATMDARLTNVTSGGGIYY